MYKKLLIIVILVLSIFICQPLNSQAKIKNSIIDPVYKLDEDDVVNKDTELEDILGTYNQEQRCEGDNSILGNVNNKESVAWLLQQLLNFIKVIGPILVIILSSIDFIKVIVNSDDEAMRKAWTKLFQRLVLAALLFFVPVLVEAMLDVFGLTSNTTCGIN